MTYNYNLSELYFILLDRKRMSVIVRDTAGDIWLYCKGADNTVLPLVHEGKLESAKISVGDFAMVSIYAILSMS